MSDNTLFPLTPDDGPPATAMHRGYGLLPGHTCGECTRLVRRGNRGAVTCSLAISSFGYFADYVACGKFHQAFVDDYERHMGDAP